MSEDGRKRRRLGRTEIEVTSIGLGCWQFSGGKGLSGGFWGTVPQATVDAIVGASLDGGVSWFDTAEIYGRGASELALAKALQAAGKKNGDVVVATKWFALLRTAGSLRATIDERLRCLSPFGIDLHQIHQPLSLASIDAMMRVMGELATQRKTRSVGVSNFNAKQLRVAHASLAARGLPLATNQMPYSLLNRRIERNGVIAAAKELGVTVIAYSPLAQGVLTGKFHDDPGLISSRAGPRKFLRNFHKGGLAKSRPVIEEVRAISKAHGVAPAQVALAWLLQFHGDIVVAIPGATQASHVLDNVGAMNVRLTATEVQRLDEVSRPFL